MKSYKNIALFALAWLLIFFVAEFLLATFFDDQTPLWKLLAISFISALAVAYPFLKSGKDFTLEQVKKKQHRTIAIGSEKNTLNLITEIESHLKAQKFKVTHIEKDGIRFRSRMRLSTFGEKYKLRILSDEIHVESLPAFYTLPIDGGLVYNEMNRIDAGLKELIA